MSDPAPRSESSVHPDAGAGRSRQNGLAIAALVTGIIALLLSWLPGINLISIVLGLVAVITGVLGLRAAPANGGRGLAIAGLVTGVLGLLLAILVWVGIMAFLDDPEVQQELERIEQEAEQQDGG